MKPLIPFVGRLPKAEAKSWQQHLAALLPEADIRLFSELTTSQYTQCQVAIVANPDPADLQKLPSLRWVHSVWAGVERMMLELEHLPIDVVRLVDPNLAETMAEAVLAWTLYLHRDMPAYRQQQAARQWLQRPYVKAGDRNIGILGLGHLGLVSANRLKANGFNVAGWGRSPKVLPDLDYYYGKEGLQALLQRSDILVNLLPLTRETRGLLSAQEFALMKPGAALINFGRGATINQQDLLAALDNKGLSHAVLDVFEQEPLAEESPLWRHPALTLLPHISAPTDPVSASRIVAQNIQRYLSTGEIPSTVDRKSGY